MDKIKRIVYFIIFIAMSAIFMHIGDTSNEGMLRLMTIILGWVLFAFGVSTVLGWDPFSNKNNDDDWY